jgi:DNA-binding CsgD family transcriptional regulator
MQSSLCISILSPVKPDKEEIRFYETDDWSIESEKQLIAKIQDIFLIARKFSQSAQISITIETNEVKELFFQLQRKINKVVVLNNQKLSIREIEVLGLIMQGLTNNEIADRLFISYETVKSHRKNILEKTGAKNTAALINHYHQTFFEKE